MLRKMIVLVVAGLVALLSAGTAVANPMPFALGFDGSTTPGTGWTLDGRALATSSSDGDIYSLGVTDATSVSRWQESGGVWDPQNKLTTIEYRLDIVSAVGLRLQLFTGINGSQSIIQLDDGATQDTLTFRGSSDQGSDFALQVDPGFHKIRVTYDEDGPGQFGRIGTVYIDDATPVVTNWTGFSVSYVAMEWGDTTGGAGQHGQIDVDYISWTHDGLYPLPEPASVAVLALGGLLIRRRKLVR